MTTISIGHSLTVNAIAKTWLSDTFLNIQKRRESVQFKTTSSPNNLNIAFIQGQTLNSETNLSIRDRSTTLPENRGRSRNIDQSLNSVNGFDIETEQFLVTDEFTVPLGNQPELPLFYKHVVRRSLLPGESYSDIQVLDTNFRPVTLIELKVDLTNGIVYNNLVNTLNQTSGIFKLFYVSYLIRDIVTGVLSRFTEIASNEPVYRPATFADLDSFGNFLPGVKAFILQEGIGSTFTVRLPLIDDYGVRRLQEQRLRLLPPPPSDVDDPWFVTVQNSNFISAVNVGLSTPSIFKYRIAELTVQNFSPFFPFKLATETSFRASRRIVKTIQDKIVQDPSEGLFIQVAVFKKDGSLKFVLTSDPAKVGQYSNIAGKKYANVLLGDSTVAGYGLDDSTVPVAGSSVDSLYGFIILPAGFEMDSTDTVESSYYYEEDKYEISFLNMNPLADTDLTKKRIVIFCRPEPLGSTLTQSLFYLVVNEDGLVTESNYDIDGIEASLYDGLEVQVAIENSQLWYDRDPSLVTWAAVGSVDFVDKYTVQGTPNIQGFLILGEVYVRESVQPNSLNINDIRTRGGGFDPLLQEELEEIQPEASWNWDVGMWDGYPYPGAGSVFIDVPVHILEDCGGLFSPGSVKGIVERHLGYGIYPVVHKYNNYEPTVTGVHVTGSGFIFSWTEHPEDTIFDVYVGTLQGGPYEQVVTGINQMPAVPNKIEIVIPAGVNRFVLVTGRMGTDGPVCFSGPVTIKDPGTDVPPSVVT